MKYKIFIISHNRADNLTTFHTLHKQGINDNIYIVIDNYDNDYNRYLKLYDDMLIVFDKDYYINSVDVGIYPPITSSAIYARNAVEDIAKNMKLDAYIILDDDIDSFRYRYNEDGKLKGKLINNLNLVFDDIVDYIIKYNISCASTGYQQIYMSGVNGFDKTTIKHRLLAEAFFRNLKFDVKWYSDVSEDYITSIFYGRRGQVWIQLPFLQVSMPTACTGKQSGGNQIVYKKLSRFKQLYFSTMFYPDSYKFHIKNDKLYNAVKTNNVLPYILKEN